MHHLYPSLKGDQLCPLGFHPQTRYPTRCKRCFRDYKEHGARRSVDDVAASSPNLSDAQNSRPSSRTWTSTQNLSMANGNGAMGATGSNDIELKKRPQSWASTPDIDEVDAQKRSVPTPARTFEDHHNVDVTVKLPVPPRRHTTTLDLKEVENSLTQNRANPAATSKTSSIPDELVILSTDSLAERVRKMNLLKKQRTLNSRENSRERSVPRKDSDSETESKPPPDRPERNKTNATLTELKRAVLPPKKTTANAATTNTSTQPTSSSTRPMSMPTISEARTVTSTTSATTTTKVKTSNATTSASRKESDRQKATEDVKFMLKIKDAKRQNQQDTHSLTTETTDTTLVGGANERELQEELKHLRNELEAMKTRAERAERDKSDILLRRLASMDTASNRTAASEALMLQQKLNEMKEQLDKVTDDKRKLNSRMKEMEHKGGENELKRKLQAAEQICEELMEENQAAKKEIMNLQAEMDELQDTFRDDEVKAKTNLQKDLEKATKNCRILSFKLKKCERRIDTLEVEKQSGFSDELSAKVKRLEEELRFSNELTRKLQTEADELRNPGKKKAPMLGVLGKSTSADGKITRESLTRGGSQEDPAQLQRELQDSIERETDLKDQLKFAEEELQRIHQELKPKQKRMNRGTQTFVEQHEKLSFPRGTQTIVPQSVEVATGNHVELRDVAVGNQVAIDALGEQKSNDAAVQTDAMQDTAQAEVTTERGNERESSPFITLFAPTTSTGARYKTSSLLFPTAFSHVFMSGATAIAAGSGGGT